MAKRLGIDTRVSRSMIDIGVMCARLQRFEEAERIIRAIKDFRDDVPIPGTALALMFLESARTREAIEELNAVLSLYPNHQLGKAVLGLAYREAGQHGWERILQEVIEDGRDEWAIRLIRDSLGPDDLQSVSAAHATAASSPAPALYV